MNYRKLNRLSKLYFWAILTIGIVYFTSTSWIFVKSFPGALMLGVNILDSRKYGYSLESYGTISAMWVSLGLWLLSLILLWRSFAAGIGTLLMVGKTRRFTKGLKIVSQKGRRIVFESNMGEIFTAGIFIPKIYVANGLGQLHNRKEIKAMMVHEVNHAKSKDPLRTTMVMMIARALPGFPGKEKVTRYFHTLVEVCADKRAEEKLKNKLPLITALNKRLSVGNRALSAGINFFNSQSERIGLLVGQKKLNKNLVFGMVGGTVLSIIMFSYLVTEVKFYNCPHLSLCLSAITSVLELH